MKTIYPNRLISIKSGELQNNLMQNVRLTLTLGILILNLSISKFSFSQNQWNGKNAVGNFSYCDNWYNGTCPNITTGWNSSTDLLFQYRDNASQLSLYFNLGGWKDVKDFIFNSTFGQSTPLTGDGNGINIYGKLENNSPYKQTIGIPTSFKGSEVQINAVSADMDMNSIVYNNLNKTINIYGPNSKLLTFNNYIEGNGSVSLNINQYSKVAINYDMTGKSPAAFSGGVNINIGEFWIGAGGVLNGGSIKVGNGNSNICKFYVSDIDGGTTVSNAINVPASSTNSYIGGLNTSGTNTLSGTITLNAAPTFENYGGGTLEIQGGISGSSVAVNIGRVSGTGNSVIKYSTNAKTYTGLTTVNGNATLQLSLANVLPSTNNITVASTGLLNISANQTINDLNLSAGGNLTVDAGCTLTINGTYSSGVGTITNNGKIVLVGPSSFPGASSTIGAMNDLEINRASGVTLDKALTVAGTLTLTSGSLSGSLSYGANGILTYNGTSYTTTSNVEFPSTNGPKDLNITVANASGISLHANRTLAGNLTIAASQKFIIPASMQLTVTGSLANNASSAGLVVESTGSLITNGSVSGSATIKREITEDFKWHFLSSPVSSQLICDGNFAPLPANFNETTGLTFDFYKWSETNQTSNLNWLNLKGTGYSLNTTDFGATPTFGVGTGYLVAYGASFAGSSTKAFSGPLTTGDQTIALTTGGNKWNLIGNPFASAINWDDVTKTNLVNGYYSVYNENKSGGAGYEYYLDGTHKTTGANGKISAMQGFFVQASGASIVLPNAARVHDDNWMKSTQSTPVDQLNIKLNNGINYDEASLIFEAQGTTGLDYFDAAKMFSLSTENPQVYSINSDGNNIAINSMPYNSESFSIPLGTYIPSDGNFTLELSGIETFTSTPVIVLQDLKLNTVQDINVNPVYEFTGSATDNPNRFVLNFNAVTVGTTEPSLPEALRIYANAGNIYLSGATGKADVYVRNMLGQTVIQRSVNGDALKVINAANLKAGVYIVSVVNNAQTISTKVVIK